MTLFKSKILARKRKKKIELGIHFSNELSALSISSRLTIAIQIFIYI